MSSERVQRRDRSVAVFVLGVVLTLVAVLPFAGYAGAQEATPEPAGAGLGLPEVIVTAQESVLSIRVAPPVLEGWTLVTLVNESEAVAGVNVALLPEEQSVGDLTSVVSTSFTGEGGELPDWWSDATFGGGAYAAPGETSQGVVYLTPGQWVVFSTNPAAVQPAQTISVLTDEEASESYGIEPEATPVAATPVDATPVVEGLEADGEISITDGAYDIASDPESGVQLWQVMNDGAQVADLVLFSTDEELDEAGAADLGTAFASGETVDGAILVGGVGTLSSGGTAYLPVNLEAGDYVIVSTQPDVDSGIQASNGLVASFVVE